MYVPKEFEPRTSPDLNVVCDFRLFSEIEGQLKATHHSSVKSFKTTIR